MLVDGLTKAGTRLGAPLTSVYIEDRPHRIDRLDQNIDGRPRRYVLQVLFYSRGMVPCTRNSRIESIPLPNREFLNSTHQYIEFDISRSGVWSSGRELQLIPSWNWFSSTAEFDNQHFHVQVGRVPYTAAGRFWWISQKYHGDRLCLNSENLLNCPLPIKYL